MTFSCGPTKTCVWWLCGRSTAALHTYIEVLSIDKARVTGLKGGWRG